MAQVRCKHGDWHYAHLTWCGGFWAMVDGLRTPGRPPGVAIFDYLGPSKGPSEIAVSQAPPPAALRPVRNCPRAGACPGGRWCQLSWEILKLE